MAIDGMRPFYKQDLDSSLLIIETNYQPYHSYNENYYTVTTEMEIVNYSYDLA